MPPQDANPTPSFGGFGLRRCKELGVSTLLLHNMEEQATARGMYERMGFQRAPEFDFRPTEDRVVMAYKLDL